MPGSQWGSDQEPPERPQQQFPADAGAQAPWGGDDYPPSQAAPPWSDSYHGASPSQDAYGYPGYYGYEEQQRGYRGPEYYAAESSEDDARRGSSGPMLALLIVLLVVLLAAIGGLAWWYFGNRGDDPEAAATATSATSTPAEPARTTPEDPTHTSTATSTASEDKARPSEADLPSGVQPANEAARVGEVAGDFNSVYLSGPTSESFAQAVRDAYVRAYLDDNETDQDLDDVYSPVTGEHYSVTCRDQGSYVHCTGGNNANVYIA